MCGAYKMFIIQKNYNFPYMRRRTFLKNTTLALGAIKTSSMFDPHSQYLRNEKSTMEQYPELIIPSNTRKVLPAQTHIFSKIIIEPGAVLEIEENSSNWCILFSKGDVTLNGQIVFKNFASGLGGVTAISPSGRTLSHEHKERNRGGAGGNGGLTQGPSPTPGKGSPGTSAYGGGGGSGCGYIKQGNQKFPGNDANEETGGARPTGRGGKGGDGVRRGNTNGGLLLIYSSGNFDGSGGLVDLSGSNGNPGSGGGLGDGDYNRSGSGGGGGGEPGGEGGCFILEVKGNSNNYPEVRVNGGLGGQPGKAGNSISFSGQDGKAGEKGLSGKIEIIPR